MRCVLASLAVLGSAPQASAADLGILRGSDVYGPGPAVYYNWSGIYLGGQAGYANANGSFANATASLIAHMLRNTTLENDAQVSQWTVLGSADVRDVSYGAFIGYNSQWEQVVLGVEANYNRISASVSDSDSLRRIVSAGGDIYDVTVTSEAGLRITDYGTIRGRAGWVMGRFLPYAMLGFALGRVETIRTASVIAFDAPTGLPYPPLSSTETKATYAIGYAAGAGIDVALLPNVFLRGEVEWLQFTNLPDMEAHITTGRIAAGLKF
jgi:opacity protein-like surface antigen